METQRFYYLTHISAKGSDTNEKSISLYDMQTQTLGKFGSEEDAMKALKAAVDKEKNGYWYKAKVVNDKYGDCIKLEHTVHADGMGDIVFEDVYFIETRDEEIVDTNDKRLQKEHDIDRFMSFIREYFMPKSLEDSGFAERYLKGVRRKLVEWLG